MLNLQGIICSGVGYYVQGVVMKTRGPVFVTAFNPLSMIIVAIMGSLILHETMYLGRSVQSYHPEFYFPSGNPEPEPDLEFCSITAL